VGIAPIRHFRRTEPPPFYGFEPYNMNPQSGPESYNINPQSGGCANSPFSKDRATPILRFGVSACLLITSRQTSLLPLSKGVCLLRLPMEETIRSLWGRIHDQFKWQRFMINSKGRGLEFRKGIQKQSGRAGVKWSKARRHKMEITSEIEDRRLWGRIWELRVWDASEVQEVQEVQEVAHFVKWKAIKRHSDGAETLSQSVSHLGTTSCAAYRSSWKQKARQAATESS